MPDLIDTHWQKTLATVNARRSKETTILIPGRGYAVILGTTPRILRIQEEDPLLRDKNIQDYMDDVLAPFVGQVPRAAQRRIEGDPKRLFVNTVTSIHERDIAPQRAHSLLSQLRTRGVHSITLSAGVAGVEKDRAWCEQFSKLPSIPNVSVVQFRDLHDIATYIKQTNTGFGITVDTSVNHLFTRIGLPHVTLYDPSFPDTHSIQSLTSDSALGFCSYARAEFPLLLCARDEELSAAIHALMNGTSTAITAASGEHYQTILHALPQSDTAQITRALYREISTLHDTIAQQHIALPYSPQTLLEKLTPDELHRGRGIVRSAFAISPVWKTAVVQ
jgi:hypothetical protein